MSRRFRTFSLAWAAATFFHQAADGAWTASASDLVVTLAAAAVLLRPARPAVLLLLSASQLVDLWTEMPYVSNHWLFAGAVNLLLLLIAASRWRIWRSPPSPDSQGEAFFAQASAPLRASVVVLYGWTAFHKLNRGYLDPQASCGSDLLRRLLGQAEGSWIDYSAIYGSLALEMALPLLLLVPRTRGVAFLFGGTFHLMLGWVPLQMYANFSSVLLACYLAFLPRSVANGRGSRDGWEPGPWLGAAVILAFAAVELVPMAPEARALGLRVVWTAWGVFLLGVLLAAWRRRDQAPPSIEESPAAFFPKVLPWLVPALILLNGLSPYLGGKTEIAFAMYSNLRTETPANHLLLGKLTGRYQDDLVEIVASTDPALSALAERGHRLARFQLASYLTFQARGVTEVRYRGEGYQLKAGEAPPEPFRPPPYLLRKLLYFRPVPDGDAAPCSH